VVSSTPRPYFTPGKDPVPVLQEAVWAPDPVWTGGKSRPHLDSIPDHPARSQSLYRLSYPAHTHTYTLHNIYIYIHYVEVNIIYIYYVEVNIIYIYIYYVEVNIIYIYNYVEVN